MLITCKLRHVTTQANNWFIVEVAKERKRRISSKTCALFYEKPFKQQLCNINNDSQGVYNLGNDVLYSANICRQLHTNVVRLKNPAEHKHSKSRLLKSTFPAQT